MSAARNLLDVARRIRTATIFVAGVDPEELPTIEAAAKRLREIAGPGDLTFTPGRAAYPDFDPFWILTVRRAGETVAYFADRWADEVDLQAGRKILQAAL